MSNIRIGISGWRYAPWRGVFYPKTLTQNRELEFASRRGRTQRCQTYFTDARVATRKRDIYCYFDNDIKVKAPFDAKRLLEKLGLGEGLNPFSWQGD